MRRHTPNTPYLLSNWANRPVSNGQPRDPCGNLNHHAENNNEVRDGGGSTVPDSRHPVPCNAQQVDDDLMARRRVFKPIGPGLRAVRRGRDGKFYVLTSPGSTVSVFDEKGALLKKIPDYTQNAGPA